jgi:hypothetical protein
MREDDQLDADDKALVAKLKALPPDGTEPDWQVLEAAIRAEVGEDAPRPWWRNWRWIVPVWALGTTAVIAFVLLRGSHVEQTASTRPAQLDAGAHDEGPAAPAREAMWLDGEVVELDDVSGSALDELDGPARAALAPEGGVTGGILPVADYGWIDTLDDEALVAAEDWLARKKS